MSAKRAFAVVVLVGASACAPAIRTSPSPSPLRPATVTSNITRADYAGSQACAECHPQEHEAWARSPMHNMTRGIDAATVHAPFAGERFVLKADDAQMETKDGQRFVTIHGSGRARIFRVTRVIGGHHREDFAGIEVDRLGAGAVAASGDRRPTGEERVLPISYMLEERAYRYKGYSVMTPERPGLRPGAPWARTCIFCHNTEPYLITMLGALTQGSSPYQGEVVDALLPDARRRRFVVSGAEPLRVALDGELRAIGGRALERGPIDALATQAIRQIRGRFEARHLLEVGIGCESCHGGSKEHVLHSATKPSYLPHASFLSTSPTPVDPVAARAQAINRTCARCHQVLFTGYPFAWEGTLRKDAQPGGSHINSGEGRDLLLGSCATKMACTACHDPHAKDRGAALAKIDGIGGNPICLGCHEKYAAPAALAAHSHHDPAGVGGACMSCHMPKKNMTLDSRLGRYHRVGSPNDPVRVERDRPLECALCHADKRVAELVDTMEAWWGKRYDRKALRDLYGELNANVMRATLARGKAHEQVSAIYTLGASGARDAAPLIAAQLLHPYPILRYYARNALVALLGPVPAGVTLDVHADALSIVRASERWLATVKMKPLSLGASLPSTSASDED